MKKKAKQIESTSTIAPVKYRSSVVWIGAAALRKVPDATAPIEAIAHRGDILTIMTERDGFCQLDNGLWVLDVALKKQE